MRKSLIRERTPSLRGRLIVRAQRGMLTAQSWPKKRTGPRNLTNEYWTEWLRQADILAKYAPDVIQITAREAAAGSAQMPRDLIISSMRGRLFYITWEDGHRTFPMAAARDVSDSLDILGDVPGSIFYRGPSLWTPLGPGLNGQVLAFNAPAVKPEWKDPTGASSNYTAPLLASFPTLTGSPTPTLAQAPPGPLVMNRAAAGTGQRLGSALKALATPPRTYTFGLRHVAELLSNMRWGIVVRDNASGKSVSFTCCMVTATSTPRLQPEYWTSDTAWSSTPSFKVITHSNTLFLRLVDDGTNFKFYCSADDANFELVATLGRTAHLASPSHVGFCVGSGTTESIGATLAAFHYHDE